MVEILYGIYSKINIQSHTCTGGTLDSNLIMVMLRVICFNYRISSCIRAHPTEAFWSGKMQ